MPWKETTSMKQRAQFIDDYLSADHTVTELCLRYGISRKTGYKWIDRFMAGDGLEDRSSRPHHSPNAVPRWVEDEIVEARKSKPRWGPRKLRQWMLRANPGVELPSVSTFATILRRNGLVRPRRKRRKTPPSSAPLAHATGPNAVWCIDFKGDFDVGGRRCYPLTVMDAYSRYLLACVVVARPNEANVRAALERVFDEFGLPAAIRSDNGPPFASTGLAGLTALSVWWLRLGIRHERIEPGKPQQNGRHERMHLTLQQETASPPQATLRAQQREFDRFRKEYNHDRPHDALDGDVPADHYERSKRRLPHPLALRPFRYPALFEVTTVSRTGRIEMWDRGVFLSSALTYQRVGLQWREPGDWLVHLGPLHLGTIRRGPGRRVFLVSNPSPASPQ